MQKMTVRDSSIVRYLLVAAAIVIVVFGLKLSSDVLAPIFLAATLAILFSPMLWWTALIVDSTDASTNEE